MMKRFLSFLAPLLLVSSTVAAFAQEFADIQQHKTCKYCNMSRQQYAYSRMLIIYSDGTEFGSCSLHCVAVDLALNTDKVPKAIFVADYNDNRLIEAENAHWVVGGNLPGVMTKRAKWAFKSERDAREFIQVNGGVLTTFEQAMKASYEDMYDDSKMIRSKRKLKKMQVHP